MVQLELPSTQERTTQPEPPPAQVETTQPEPSPVQASASAAGRTKEDVFEASLATVVMGRASASALSAPPTAGGAVPEVEPPQEGSVLLGVGTASRGT
jgi:hypothetical protein